MKFPVKSLLAGNCASQKNGVGKPAVKIDSEEIDENGFAVPSLRNENIPVRAWRNRPRVPGGAGRSSPARRQTGTSTRTSGRSPHSESRGFARSRRGKRQRLVPARYLASSRMLIWRVMGFAGIEFIDENGGGPGVRLRKRKAKPRK